MTSDASFPAHASPAFTPHDSPPPSAIDSPQRPSHTIADLHLANVNPLPSLVSPAFTPPATPGTGTPALLREPKSVPVDTSALHNAVESSTQAALLPRLPNVRCEVRARIPTTTGQQMYLYLYHNDVDNKEHLAIVFGDHIRSASLDAPREGETERDRMIRGAYVGRLHPGRTSSRVQQIKREHGVKAPSPLHQQATVGGEASEEEAASASEAAASEAAAPAAQPAATPSPQPASPDSTPSDYGFPSHQSPLVRIHSECYTGETVWSARCDCGEQLDEAHRLMCLPSNASAGGAIIYLRQEGRGIGLGEKLKAYNLQDLGHDTYEANLLLRHPADARSYGLATAMLVDLGLGGARGIRLLTNNPDKIRAVEGPGREVVVRERVAMVPIAWQTGGAQGVQGREVEQYLSTKIDKFKHLLSR